MILHASTEVVRDLAPEIVVVGAGPAGLAVASRLAAAGQRLVVLDSGGYEPTADRDAGAAGSDQALPYFDLSACRPRGLGGSTTLWGGWCEPFDEFDLKHRPIHGESGWCISAQELERYYHPAREFCGLPDQVWSRGWRRADELRLNGAPFELRTFGVLGPRQLGHQHAGLFDGAGVDLVLGATVTRVVTTPDGTSVDHLVVATGDGAAVLSADRYVLAAGGIETARLLLVSTGSAWPDGLGNGSGMVGRCFMEHPHVDAVRFRGDAEAFDIDFFGERRGGTALDGTPMAVAGCLLLSEDICHDEQVGRVQLFIEPAGDHQEHPIPRVLHGEQVRYPAQRETDDELAVIIATEQLPDRRSRVVLGEGVDRHGVPLPVLRWELSDLDHRTAEVGVESVLDLLRELGGTDVRSRLDRGWPMDTLGGPHHLGAARMARVASDGVVDEDCRVHDVENLYIAGGAVFPTSGHGPPTLTVVALALRLGDHLARSRHVSHSSPRSCPEA